MATRMKITGRKNTSIQENKKEKNIFIEIVDDYVNTSTLHGVSYLGAKDKSILEKSWWLIMLCISIGTCIFLISKTWIKWKNNPVILSFEKEQVSLWSIPFPAVTVCPVNKVQQMLYNYTYHFRSNLSDLDEDELEEFWDISLVCNLDEVYENITCPDIFSFRNESAIENIRNVAPEIDTLFQLYWQNKPVETEGFFSEHLTEEGRCFTFNGLSQEDMYTDELKHNIVFINHSIKNEVWTLERGYSDKVKLNSFPRRSGKDGQLSGLSFILQTSLSNLDWVCGSPFSGYKLMLHSPSDLPKVSQHYFLVPLKVKMTYIVQPELTKTEDSVRHLSIEGRKCYFSGEKKLRFFKIYSQHNCKVECNANVTKHYCGCVPFYMPRDNKTLICGYPKIECIREAEMGMMVLDSYRDWSELEEEYRVRVGVIRDVFSVCKCLPACYTLDYTAETSQTELHLVESMLQSGAYDDEMDEITKAILQIGDVQVSRVDIFFKESQFLALQRSELFGQTDFFANCGGLLGLFMGFSLLSALEIVYFLTIRLFVKYKNRRKINIK